MSLALLMLLTAAAPDGECGPPRTGGIPVVVDERFRNVTIERYVDAFFSEGFNASVAPRMGMRSRELLSDETLADGTRQRRVRMTPDIPSPGPLLALANADDLYYDEVTTYDPRTREVRFFIATVACDRVKYGGTIRFLEEGTGVHLHVEALLDVDAPIVGGLIEQLVLSGVRDGYVKLGDFMQAWLDERYFPRVSPENACDERNNARRWG